MFPAVLLKCARMKPFLHRAVGLKYSTQANRRPGMIHKWFGLVLVAMHHHALTFTTVGLHQLKIINQLGFKVSGCHKAEELSCGSQRVCLRVLTQSRDIKNTSGIAAGMKG